MSGRPIKRTLRQTRPRLTSAPTRQVTRPGPRRLKEAQPAIP